MKRNSGTIPDFRQDRRDTQKIVILCLSNQILMEKKEYYKHILPHFQQPGQVYFVTWCLKDAVPPKALKRYTDKLKLLKSQIEFFKGTAPAAASGAAVSDSPKSGAAVSKPPILKIADRNPHHPEEEADRNPHHPELQKLKQEYNLLRKKYIKAFDDLLDAEKYPAVDLSKPENTKAIAESLLYWEGIKLENHAFCIMNNHIHWVFRVFEKDAKDEPVYLQDIMYSVKRFTSNRINALENRKGTLWQKESFDTTIRDEKHLYYAIRYTLNNPVSAGLVNDWKDWPGCRSYDSPGAAVCKGAAVSEPPKIVYADRNPQHP